jgi:glutamate---cysteine ligase / carboxylate-amine ligase
MPAAIRLFAAYGVELEYMIVDAQSLNVLPITDEVLRELAGEYTSQVDMPDVSWSNELVLHVIELKTAGPAAALEPLGAVFQEHVDRINRMLEPRGARLMPSAMHPWMDPAREMKLWPHDYSPVYEAYDRIFDCRGHGWANLQSVHLNLPFGDDEEFGRLHAATRLLLPILPALAASSPIVDRRRSGLLDTRLDVYRTNARRVPSCTGLVIPEPVFSGEDYRREILQRMYDDIAPLDPDGVLQDEFLNSRGAIARFDRNTIEIRVLDVQECPAADVAICIAISRVLQAMVAERWTDLASQQSAATEPLAEILAAVVRDADQATIRDPAYLRQFGFPCPSCTVGELWGHLAESLGLLSSSLPACERLPPTPAADSAWQPPLQVILDHGPLARRILRCLPVDAAVESLQDTYRELCDCLANGRMFGCD